MTREEFCAKIGAALDAYFGDRERVFEPYGNGHINDTFLVVAGERYILQRMKHEIFTEPERMMENIVGVTEHIRKKTAEVGGDVKRCTLIVLPTRSGELFYRDSIGSYWRFYEFIEGTVTRETIENAEDFYTYAVAFGEFQRQLADHDAEKLFPQ